MRALKKIRPLAALALAVLAASPPLAHAALQKNVAGQGFYLFDYDTTNNAPKTGDSANITVYRSLDGGTATAITGSVTEISATSMPGVYWVSVSQADTNGNLFAFVGTSSTSGCRCDPFLGATNATQTGDSYARVSVALPAVAAGSDGGLPTLSNGTVGANLKFINGNSATSAGNVTFPSAISSLTQAQVTGGAYPLQTDASGYIKISSGTGAGQITLTAGAVTAGTVSDKAGYSLATAPPTAAQVATAVWQDLTSSADFTAVGSAGKLLTSDLDTNISSRVATSSLPTNYSALSIDTSGRVLLQPTQTGVTIPAVTTTGTVTNAITLPTNAPTGWINAAAIGTGALNGKGDWTTVAPDNADIASILTNTTQLPNLVTGTGVNAQFTAKALALAPGSTGGLTTDQDTKLTDIYTQTASIIAGKVEARSPLLQNGTHLVLVRGDDYTQAAGQPLEWTDTGGNWPDLTGATITLTIRAKNKDGTGGSQLLQTVGSYVPGTPNKIRIEPTAAATAALTPGNRVNVFDVRATLSGGQIVTLVRGENTVLDDETR